MATLHCIALTGGPCGGKSSALKSIQSKLKEQGIDVYLVPEVPTVIMQGGATYPGVDGGSALVAFESAIIQLQIQMERSFATIARSTGRPSLIICDRGLLDIAAYLPRQAWLNVLVAMGLTEEELLGRYDGVLHLVTSADGAEKFYKYGHVKDDSGNDVYRAETPEMARDLDSKVFGCWSGHGTAGRIGNEEDGFAGKLARATQFVSDVVCKTPTSRVW
mmetsp:Transcript_1053/g.1436  ORF Transcript_1053/g.1436 Transcript_1053/m.1436 type:complete len:219 (-) Transcript_1053:126-782(-)